MPVFRQMTVGEPSKTPCMILLEGTAYPIRYVLRHIGGLTPQQPKHRCCEYTSSSTAYMDCGNVQTKQLFRSRN